MDRRRFRLCLFQDQLVSYSHALALQLALKERCKEGLIPNTILCLQHNNVFTVGKRGTVADIKASLEEVRRSGAEVHFVKRGGEVTYHGPGQCILYPIMNIRKTGPRVFVDALQNSIVSTLRVWGIEAEANRPKTAGVWVGERKIGAIGVQFSQGVSTHGAALNIDVDKSWFNKIVPCGEPNAIVTTMVDEADKDVNVLAVQRELIKQFMIEHQAESIEEISHEQLLHECNLSEN